MIDIDQLFVTIRETTKNVLMTLSSKAVVAGDIIPSDKNNLVGYVSGNVGMTGEMKISITVSFSKPCINGIYSTVFPDEKSDITVFHVGDLVGEITNMISGNVRSLLAGLEMKFDSSIPTVVVGSQQIFHPTGTIAKVMPFTIDGEYMFVEIGIKVF